VKVTFDAAQQEKVNGLIREAQGRAAADLRAELAASKVAAEAAAAELAAAKVELAKQKPLIKPEDQTQLAILQSQMDEMKAATATGKAENERLAQLAKKEKADADAARAEISNINKKAAITAAASKAGFFDPSVAATMTSGQVVLDQAGNYVVMNENGTPRMNASLDPMSLEEFYAEYASKNAWMVRSGVLTGTGSTESAFGISSNGKYVLTELFGPKANSKKVNDLAMHNNKKYKELRAKAVAEGLVNA
jgi:hypothetical protein